MSRVVGLLASEMTSKGGIQSFMLRIAEVINKNKFDGNVSHCYCISLNDKLVELQNLGMSNNKLIYWGAGRSKIKLIIYLLFKLKYIDVLFIGHLSLGPVAYILKKLKRIKKYMIILHGQEAWQKAKFLEIIAIKDADEFVSTTQYTAKKFIEVNNLKLKNINIIPLCVQKDLGKYLPDFKLEGIYKVLCVARLNNGDRYKGIEHIIESIHNLKDTIIGIHLHVIGTGDDKKRLEEISAKFDVLRNVTFWGQLCEKKLLAAYHDCDIFVMPSLKEGFGIVFLEAMLNAKPCIGGNNCGTMEVIEHNRSGFLVDYGDVQKLSEYMALLYEDKLLKFKLGERGRQLVIEKFNFNKFYQQYSELILK